jgi:hypothetical protein
MHNVEYFQPPSFQPSLFLGGWESFQNRGWTNRAVIKTRLARIILEDACCLLLDEIHSSAFF